MDILANMSFISLPFYLLAALAVLLYYLLPKHCQWVVLLLSSIAFYFTYGFAQFIPMLLAALAAYLVALLYGGRVSADGVI